MNAIKRWSREHPELWEFILFNVLSNCATITGVQRRPLRRTLQPRRQVRGANAQLLR